MRAANVRDGGGETVERVKGIEPSS
jgi:hypothetical protein